jgi:hypothetical protein
MAQVAETKNPKKHQIHLEEFAENLLLEKDLTNVDETTRLQMREDLVDRLEQVTNRVVVDSIPPEKLFEFEQLIDEGASPAEVQKFVSENVTNLDQKLTEAYFNFRKLYLGL